MWMSVRSQTQVPSTRQFPLPKKYYISSKMMIPPNNYPGVRWQFYGLGSPENMMRTNQLTKGGNKKNISQPLRPPKKKHIAKFSRKMFLLHLGTRGPGTRGSQGDLWASTLFCLSVALQCLGFFFFPSIPLQPFWVWLGDKGTGTWGGLGGHGGAGFSSSQLYHYNLLGFNLGTRGLRPHYNLRVWHGSRDVIAFLRVSGDYWLRTREWGLHRESWELGARTIADWYLEYDIMDIYIYIYIYIYCLYI